MAILTIQNFTEISGMYKFYLVTSQPVNAAVNLLVKIVIPLILQTRPI